MADHPVAAHTFDFVRVYLSTRDLAVPGSGAWSNPTIIFDGSGDGSEADTFSAGQLNATDLQSGILADNHGGHLRFLGNGSPTAPILISVTTDGNIPSSNYWDISQGAFTINGALYIIYKSPGTDYLRIAKSTDNGATWTIQDGANGPSGLLAYDGATAAVQRVNDLLCVCTPTDARAKNFAIWEFDPATDTWGPQFANLPIPNFASFSRYGWTNSLFKFPNNDYILIYNDSVAGPVLQRWNGSAWGAQKALPSGDYANSLMDPTFDTVHIFTYTSPGNISSSVAYSLYDHNTDTITGSITTISDPGGTSDGVGHCSIQGGMIFVPRDRSLDFDNAVWVATLPVVTFSKELLPIPPEEAGLISSFAVNPGGTGYLVNDTGTVNGGVVPATYRVTDVHNNAIASESLNAQGSGYAVNDTFTVNGGSTHATGKIVSVGALGVVTDWVLLTLGAGYSVASGVGTTATFGGAGTGFKLDILSLFNGVTGLTITAQGAGYSVSASVATTVGGAQPGVGVGLTINILAIIGKEPSCAYMMYPNGYSLNPAPITLNFDLVGASPGLTAVNPSGPGPGPILTPTECVNQQ